MDLARSWEKRVLKIRSLLLDRESAGLTEALLAKKLQRNPDISTKEDRLTELTDFYNVSREEILNTQSDESKAQLKTLFSNTETDEALFNGYRQARLIKTTRMMLGYTRFSTAASLLRYFNSVFPPKQRRNIHILDYGCGVGDYGLAFARFGYNVSICDIEGGNLDFSEWRFKSRNMVCKVIPVTEANPYPDFGRQDIIIAGEVFEHLRNPLKVLEQMHKTLPRGRYLWYSGYPDHPREVGYEHLAEAGEQREEALAFVKRAFKPASKIPLPGLLYAKR